MNPVTLPPGFRFHPTDEELILYYLRNRAAAAPCPVSIVAEVDIYKFDPWDLPGKALFGEREWYFFSPRDRKYPNGVRPNRAAGSGYWKATGTDKPIFESKGGNGGGAIGVKKALVFYMGRPPKGVKTAWIMHEYRLAKAVCGSSSGESRKLRGPSSMRLDDWVLCRIYKKKASMDPDQEDSALDSEANNSQANSFLKLPKVCSLTELLEAADCSAPALILENPAESNPLLHYYGYGGLVPQFNQRDSPASIADQSAKRKQVCFEEDGLAELWFPAKKSSTAARAFSCLDGSELSRQLLVNSQNV